MLDKIIFWQFYCCLKMVKVGFFYVEILCCSNFLHCQNPGTEIGWAHWFHLWQWISQGNTLLYHPVSSRGDTLSDCQFLEWHTALSPCQFSEWHTTLSPCQLSRWYTVLSPCQLSRWHTVLSPCQLSRWHIVLSPCQL